MKRIALGIGMAALAAAAFLFGRTTGIRHAIEDAEMSIVEFGDPEGIPGDFDLRIWIDLDGETYEHFGYIG